MNKFTYTILLLCISSLSFAQNLQWASKVLGFSSEYRPDKYGFGYRSKQILGEPNKLPDFGQSACAWTPSEADAKQEDWIKVGFEKSMLTKQIVIAENFNPGSITRVYGYDANGKEHLLLNTSPRSIAEKGRMLRIFPSENNLMLNAIKIVLKTDAVPGFNQIDAIGISDSNTPIEAEINLVDELNNDFKKENLGKTINSTSQEIAPVISPNGKALFFTRSNHSRNTGPFKNHDVWVSRMNSDGSWKEAENLGAPINNDGNNAVIGISTDAQTLYLINVYLPDGTMVNGLSRSTLTPAGWSFPQEYKIQNYYNDHDDTELTISGYKNVLISSLKRQDTEGDKDLYISFIQPDQSWSEPVNMGTTINTASYEGSPFLALDNKTLYFTSSGRSGYGGGDLFVTKRLDDTWKNWSKPQNLGPSINTNKWDGYFNISAVGDYAYFSSSGTGDNKEDIFRIRLTPEMKPNAVAIIGGSTTDIATDKPLEADVYIRTVSNDETFTHFKSDSTSGLFNLTLPLTDIYRITASKDGYFSSSAYLELENGKSHKDIKINFKLQPLQKGIQIRFDNSMFSQSSALINKSTLHELDDVVIAMKKYPTMEILLEGHTDNQGDVQKNIHLSEERVSNVKTYLVAEGISANRISTKAWGPAQPIASNQTEQSRQKNRRVEFTILKM